jgi:hypothetical protein
MLTYRGEYYLKKDFGFIDLGIPAAVGLPAVGVYEVLRRFVWRSATSGNGKSRKAYSNGRLVSKITQTKIASHVGIGRKLVCRQVAILRDIGWIETEGKDDEMIYVLGERVLDESGGVHEVFYADAMCRAVGDRVHQELDSREKERVSDIPIEERVELVKEFLGVCRGQRGQVTVIREEGVSLMGTGGVPYEDSPPGTLSLMGTENKRTLRGEEERVEGTLERGSLRDFSRDPAEAETLTEGTQPEEEETTRHSCPKNGNPEHTSEELDHVVQADMSERRARIEEAKKAAKARAKSQREANLKKEAAKAQKMRNLDSKGIENNDKKVKRFLEKAWRRAWAEAFDEEEAAPWDGRIRGQVMQLVKMYDVKRVEAALRYIALHWSSLSKRFKAKGKPSIDFLRRFHDTILPEVSQYAQVFAVKEEWDAWWREHPEEDPPEELERRFDKHSKEMENLGLL